MTPPPTTTPLSAEDFETEVRAMLTRRAADVSPTPAARPVDLRLASTAPRRRRTLTRRPLAAAAAALLAAGVVTYAAVRDTAPPVDTSVGAGDTPAPIIWPIGPSPASDLSEPERAARSYLDGAVLDPFADTTDRTVGPPTFEGAEATVPYAFGDVAGEIALRPAGDGWGITSVTSDALRIDSVRLVGERVEIDLRLGSAVQGGMSLRPSSVLPDGAAVMEDRTGIVIVEPGDEVGLDPGTAEDSTLLLPPGDPTARSITLDAPAGSPPPVAVRVDVLAPSDGEPTAPDRVVAHVSAPVGAAHGADGRAGEGATPPPDTAGVGPVVDDPADGGRPSGTPEVGTSQIQGSYEASERYGLSSGRCDDLEHDLQGTMTVENRGWQVAMTYCGTVDGDAWSGEGTFVLTSPDGSTLTGTMASAASLSGDGEPYALTITGGSGTYEGATGSCTLDNHLERTGFGAQEQTGTIACTLDQTAP